MGQRSQIYVRINGELIVAHYYQWNYGTRMVSRARGIIEWIYEYAEFEDNGKKDRLWFFDKKRAGSEYCTKLSRICDVNFDMKDVVLSTDIVKEYEEDGEEEKFNDYVFLQQANNDGQLYIDVMEQGIKYCFTDNNTEFPMDGDEYMKWDGYGENWSVPSEDLKEDEIETCWNNIEYLRKHANLMTVEELQEFIGKDYEEA